MCLWLLLALVRSIIEVTETLTACLLTISLVLPAWDIRNGGVREVEMATALINFLTAGMSIPLPPEKLSENAKELELENTGIPQTWVYTIAAFPWLFAEFEILLLSFHSFNFR